MIRTYDDLCLVSILFDYGDMHASDVYDPKEDRLWTVRTTVFGSASFLLAIHCTDT